MYTTIQKWGNSQGLRIPKALLDAVGLRENDRVQVIQEEDSIRIQKVTRPQHKTLEERLTAFYGKPIGEIERIENAELESGPAEGAEAW